MSPGPTVQESLITAAVTHLMDSQLKPCNLDVTAARCIAVGYPLCTIHSTAFSTVQCGQGYNYPIYRLWNYLLLCVLVVKANSPEIRCDFSLPGEPLVYQLLLLFEHPVVISLEFC